MSIRYDTSSDMRKGAKNTVIIGELNSKPSMRLDDLDMKIIVSLMSGLNNKEISRELKVPLSTIQRRTRRIFEREVVYNKVEPNYRYLGYKKGIIHLYIRNNDPMTAAKKLVEIDKVTAASIHIGNSDVVGDIVYRDNMEVLDVISQAKKIEGVERVVWSEEVAAVPVNRSKEKILSFFKLH
jgi:DNA-binding Lrp family transcriptional regulator